MTRRSKRNRGEEGAGLLIFCLILTAIFLGLIAATTNMLNDQFDHVEDDYQRAQAMAAVEAGIGHAHAVAATSKATLDVTLPYGTRYRVLFALCSTVGSARLWSITSTGWSTNKRSSWTVQQRLLEQLPGGLIRTVQGTWTLSEGMLTSTGCP